jgi:putative restriction endonuclease
MQRRLDTMTEEQMLLNAVQNLQTWRRQGQTAVHKPLLVLLALGRIQRNEPRLASFLEIEPKLVFLLQNHGPARSTQHAGYPFWRLQHDGLWEVEVRNRAEFVLRKSNTDPTLTALRKSNAWGGFIESYDRLLRARPELIRRIARTLLNDHFPSEHHEALLKQVGLLID